MYFRNASVDSCGTYHVRVVCLGLIVRLLRASVVSRVGGARLLLHGRGLRSQHVAYCFRTTFTEHLLINMNTLL